MSHTLVDFGEHYDTRKFCLGIVRDGRVEDEDPCIDGELVKF